MRAILEPPSAPAVAADERGEGDTYFSPGLMPRTAARLTLTVG